MYVIFFLYRLQSNWDEVCESFDDMNLREELLRGIYSYGYVSIFC
jgi:translation initiation factor 4A